MSCRASEDLWPAGPPARGREAALPDLESNGILARYECEKRYADIECVRRGRELCVVCEVGLGKIVELEVLGAKSDGGGVGEVDTEKRKAGPCEAGLRRAGSG